jgi:hypothetical protein
VGGETPSGIYVWSLIRNEKPIVLFEKNCHATVKSEAIACARRCRSSLLTGWWKKWRAEGEERHKGSLIPPPPKKKKFSSFLETRYSPRFISKIFDTYFFMKK